MKSIILVIALCGSSLLMAQPADNARVKPFIDKFWQYMDEIKKIETGAGAVIGSAGTKNPERVSEAPVGADDNINKLKIIADNAKKQIEHIKKRDPGFDVSKMEALLKPYFDAKKAAVDAHNGRIDALSFHSTDEGCYGLFQANTTTEYQANGNPDEDEKKHSERLEAYNKRLQNILANRMAGVEACHDYLKDRTETAKTRFNDYKIKLEKTDAEQETRFIYRELLGEEAYWNAARQLYPDLVGATEVHQMIKNYLAQNGGLEGLLSKAKEKKRERLKNTFMPKSVVINPAIESEFKKAFNNGGWGETIVKINLLSSEWTIVRHSITGVILCRTQYASIVAKQKAGNCVLYTYTIQQQYTGSGFSNVSRYYSHDVWETEFLCENAK